MSDDMIAIAVMAFVAVIAGVLIRITWGSGDDDGGPPVGGF